MKQILQNLKNGKTLIEESPSPALTKGSIIIETKFSLVSAGTEKMLVGFGKASLFNKVKQQPEKVKMVLEKIQSDGLVPTLEAVSSKLNQPIPLGYSNIGVVKNICPSIQNISLGDRIVSNGGHADVVRVGKNLCAKVPDNVDDESAAFTVVSSIGLQGVRLANPSIGESFVVFGVGLIGLIIVQLLKANGCKVLAIDFDDSKLELAKNFGAETCNPLNGEDPIKAGLAFSNNNGVDGVIIAASTDSSKLISEAANMSRKRGRIILVGVAGLNIDRADFYEKELSFQVSCSYGPGRYDSSYEELGQDYPIGFVRWTEKRNFEAVLALMSEGRLDVKPLISKIILFEDAPQMYDELMMDPSALGILLKYDQDDKNKFIQSTYLKQNNKNFQNKVSNIEIGFIGAGNYASRVLIPMLKKMNSNLNTIVSSGGINGSLVGKKNGFTYSSTSTEEIMKNSKINTLFIASQHDTHASLSIDGINAGKNIFVEKPLAITKNEIESIKKVIESSGFGNNLRLMVGFNRRFAPLVQKMKSLLVPIKEPKSFIMTMNAGFIPKEHWTQDINIGGGRIIGEACHHIDLMRFLAGSKIINYSGLSMGKSSHFEIQEDKSSISLMFEDGSFGTIHYLANGGKVFPKERIEVFCNDSVLQLDNFKSLRGYGWPGFKKLTSLSQNKGQKECIKLFIDSINNDTQSPIPLDEILEVSDISIKVSELLRSQN